VVCFGNFCRMPMMLVLQKWYEPCDFEIDHELT
jgi:hypothetical protein